MALHCGWGRPHMATGQGGPSSHCFAAERAPKEASPPGATEKMQHPSSQERRAHRINEVLMGWKGAVRQAERRLQANAGLA